VLHRVHGRDREARVDQDLDLGAVALADVRLVGGAVVDVGLDAQHGAARDLRCAAALTFAASAAGSACSTWPLAPRWPPGVVGSGRCAVPPLVPGAAAALAPAALAGS